MAFPTNPTNGQIATVNNVGYTYISTKGAWVKTGALSTASPVASVAGRTGAVTLTAADVASGAFPGNYTIGGAVALSSTLSVSAAATIPLQYLNRSAGPASGINWYSSSYNSWTTYMSPAAQTGCGPTNNITAPSGTLVTSWALRSYIENSAGYGWTFESAANGTTTPTVVAEIRSSDGSIRTAGSMTAAGSITATVSLGVGTTASGTTGQILATNSITAYYSDKRLKTEIGKIENALDKIDQLCGVIYTQNKLAETFGYNNYDEQVGLYAQDVKNVQPQAVKPAPFDIAEDGSSKSGENYLTVQYEKLVPLLVEGIKELRAEIKKLKGE